MTQGSMSVIVSIYEQRQTLEWLLSRLAEQDASHPWELLLCDDGSSVDVQGVIRRWAGRIKGEVRYIWQRDDGFRLSRSRNNGIRCAEGDLLLFLDADVIVRSDFLSQHFDAHTGANEIVCGPVVPKATPAIASLSDVAAAIADLLVQDSPSVKVQRSWFESEHPWVACPGGNMSMPRNPEVLFDQGFLEWGSEDRELAYRLVHEHAYRIRYNEAAPAFHLDIEGERTPRIRRSHEDVVALLRNKLYFRARHPEMDVEIGLGLLRHCFLDAETDTWHIAAPQEGRNVPEVIALAEQWFCKHGVSLTAQPRVPRDVRF